MPARPDNADMSDTSRMRRAFAGGRDRGQPYSRGCSPDSSGFRRSITMAPIFANRTG